MALLYSGQSSVGAPSKLRNTSVNGQYNNPNETIDEYPVHNTSNTRVLVIFPGARNQQKEEKNSEPTSEPNAAFGYKSGSPNSDKGKLYDISMYESLFPNYYSGKSNHDQIYYYNETGYPFTHPNYTIKSVIEIQRAIDKVNLDNWRKVNQIQKWVYNPVENMWYKN